MFANYARLVTFGKIFLLRVKILSLRTVIMIRLGGMWHGILQWFNIRYL